MAGFHPSGEHPSRLAYTTDVSCRGSAVGWWFVVGRWWWQWPRLAGAGKQCSTEQTTKRRERCSHEQLEEESDDHPRGQRRRVVEVLEPRADFGWDVRCVTQHEVRSALLKRGQHQVNGSRREEPDHRTENARAKTHPCTIHQSERPWMFLKRQIGCDGAASKNPEAAAVGKIDDRQRRQHPNEEAAEQNRLGHPSTSLGMTPSLRRGVNRSTRVRGA